ncbi:hypothetical protein [Treponema sp.]|uniref:hypothetical protein n=1 Tax=Treponema sp. TaxID=166 RepID=UPI00298E44A2|nr:hypothetical protein [Treponema sp.]MCQ2241486.1 hypothetical protein [Treponema sp.]
MDDQDLRGYFDRIRLFNFMAKDIVAFAAQKYGAEFLDYMDMNCGAMPEGEYDKIIDQGAPLQFLELYAGIVIKRLELASGKILELGEGFDSVIKNYFFNEGMNLGIAKPESIKEAYEIVRTCALDFTSNEDEISFESQKELRWHKKSKTEGLYWSLIMVAFMAGIFKDSPVEFSVSENMEFSLKALLQ